MGKPRSIRAYVTDQLARFEEVASRLLRLRRQADEAVAKIEDLSLQAAREKGLETHKGKALVPELADQAKTELLQRTHKWVQSVSAPMSQSHSARSLALEQQARLELTLSQVCRDHVAATYHENAVVTECAKAARDELRASMECLLKGDWQQFNSLTAVASLRIDLAHQLLEADAVEHILGESNFLELTEQPNPPKRAINYYFFELEHELLGIYSRLQG